MTVNYIPELHKFYKSVLVYISHKGGYIPLNNVSEFHTHLITRDLATCPSELVLPNGNPNYSDRYVFLRIIKQLLPIAGVTENAVFIDKSILSEWVLRAKESTTL